VLLDFDGVVADSHDAMFFAINDLAELRAARPFSRAEFSALTIPEMFACMRIGSAETPEVLEWARGRLARYQHLTSLQPQIEPFLAQASAMSIAVGILSSNGTDLMQRFIASRLPLVPFVDIIGGLSLNEKGPRLREWIGRHGYAPTEVVYIGDEVRDIMASREAGVSSIGVAWGKDDLEVLRTAGATHCVVDANELCSLVATLVGAHAN
jgi:phosphoglycolate phosphatase